MPSFLFQYISVSRGRAFESVCLRACVSVTALTRKLVHRLYGNIRQQQSTSAIFTVNIVTTLYELVFFVNRPFFTLLDKAITVTIQISVKFSWRVLLLRHMTR